MVGKHRVKDHRVADFERNEIFDTLFTTLIFDRKLFLIPNKKEEDPMDPVGEQRPL